MQSAETNIPRARKIQTVRSGSVSSRQINEKHSHAKSRTTATCRNRVRHSRRGVCESVSLAVGPDRNAKATEVTQPTKNNQSAIRRPTSECHDASSSSEGPMLARNTEPKRLQIFFSRSIASPGPMLFGYLDLV